MILDLREFETFPAQKLLIGEPDKLILDYPDVNSVKAVEINLRIQQAGEEYFCQGKVKATVDMECCRCLNGFDKEVESETDFIACAAKTQAEEATEIADDEDYVFFTGSDIQADVSDIVRQAIILSLDLKPLCAEDCKGLCPQCGINFNEQQCSCKTEKIDPRWEALKNLSGQLTENKE